MTHATAKQIAKALCDAGQHCTKETVLRWAKAEPHLWPFEPGPNRAQLFIVENLKPAIRAALLASERAEFEKPQPPEPPVARTDSPAVQPVQMPLCKPTPYEAAYLEFYSRLKASGKEEKAIVARQIVEAAAEFTLDHGKQFYRLGSKREAYARMGALIGCGPARAATLTRELESAISRGENPFEVALPGKRGPHGNWKHNYDGATAAKIAELWESRKSYRTTADMVFDWMLKRQAVVCAGHDYSIPSREAFRQFTRRYINESLGGKNNSRRIGKIGIRDRAGAIVRRYDDEFSGDSWCIDEWEVDCYCYDDHDHSIVYNYGKDQPILHLLTIIDERTSCILAWALTVDLDHEAMDLAESTLRRYWPPLRLVSDHAGRFRQYFGGRVVTRRAEEMAKLLDTPMGALGVLPVTSREPGSARRNRIERAPHREYARYAQRDFGLSWRPPKDQRENTGIDDRVKWHQGPHLKHGEQTSLISLSYVSNCCTVWIDDFNNMDTKAKGCNGMTRAAAFKYFQPPAEEIAKRKVPESVIDGLFAETFKRRVREGCQVHAPGGYIYTHLDLAYHLSEDLQCRRFRRDRSKLFVEIGDRVIEALAQPTVGVNDPVNLSKECERLAHNQKELKRENPPAPEPAPDYPHVSSTAWMMEKIERTHAARQASAAPTLQPTSQDVADEMRRIVEEHDAAHA